MSDITKDDVVQIVNEELDKRTEIPPSIPTQQDGGIIKMPVDNLDPDMNRDRFKNRRYMAWVSLISNIILVIVAILYIPAEHVDNYTGIFGYYLIISSSIILSYIGASTFSYNAFLQTKRGDN